MVVYPIISATWEAERGGPWFETNPSTKLVTLYFSSWAWCFISIILATLEVELWDYGSRTAWAKALYPT